MPRLFSIKPTLTMKGRKFKGIRGWAGKPFHPPLTDIPIGAYILAAAFDLISYVAYKRGVATNLAGEFFASATHVLVAGAVVSIFTIITGFWDWLKSAPNRTQAWRTANWHMAVMLVMSVLVATDILLRLAYWQTGIVVGSDLTITVLTLIVGVLVTFGAAYGGTMVFEYAFNVEGDFDHAYTKSDRDKHFGEEVPPTEQTEP